ncbi:MAG: VOC family protein [Deltaproteobacteria bacterium]|nr:VOC family protein [Deltaproteobacteria bacterium]MBI3388111.1 VOC family protein [Deltaproteobacteria bacterium]
MTGDLGYFTIPVTDVARGKRFYGGLFGWQFAPDADDRYAHISNTTPPGGLNAAAATSPQVWFKVTDIQAAVARVRELGGHADDPQESPSGWSAACGDDQGTHFNLWQPAPGY